MEGAISNAKWWVGDGDGDGGCLDDDMIWLSYILHMLHMQHTHKSAQDNERRRALREHNSRASHVNSEHHLVHVWSISSKADRTIFVLHIKFR